MRCPKCNNNKSSVVDSRQAEDGNTIRRRRECEECHTRFTTFERLEELPLLVIKKDGTREQFSRDKILNGVVQSAQKRPVSSTDIETLISRIEQKVRADYENEVPSTAIGNLVMEGLAELDEITYVRFASVYKSFKDVDEIEELLQQITTRVRAKKKSSVNDETH
ncbi:transcriptional repressor NrdR [Streptococcus iniae]|uniref:Transcriptional repressor NrdR n=1 Tax=Streptococcus iniae TaxID=1346 RepID=A0A1J0N0A9_STRIN|nr:transcriptional regulator NrdR [Streptococcus iniae]AGM99362.1 transcriptional regulator NrdR [Streptococcus iniae SF1]AHY16295.1 NrdR family transcriptional regulator [Streptococcus iniae]AHY18158.1 NrdR family transcriptional regulator [Streptococcus iniae]AJG26446.1 NrdR family transcriptional regulator [Streptococcus iniae]APD32321.1 transcriptional regulator NrdR [Streptococcus iniae]